MENPDMEKMDMEKTDMENADKHIKNSCIADGLPCNRFGLCCSLGWLWYHPGWYVEFKNSKIMLPVFNFSRF